jgi:hypothetical protein
LVLTKLENVETPATGQEACPTKNISGKQNCKESIHFLEFLPLVGDSIAEGEESGAA